MKESSVQVKIVLSKEEFSFLKGELEDRLDDLVDAFLEDPDYFPSVIKLLRILEKHFSFQLKEEQEVLLRKAMEKWGFC